MGPDVKTASTSNVEEAATPNAQKTLTLNYVQQRSVTPEVANIVNAPELPQQKSKKTSRKRHSIVITSTPMKDI